MASSYLDLYQGPGGLYQRNILGVESPYTRPQFSFGTPQNVSYRPGETQRVVHDKYNNIYYGQQTQADLIKGLQDSIKRTQEALTQQGKTVYDQGWMGALNQSYYRYTDKDRAEQNASIKRQQSYLKHIQNGGYKQEGNQFYKSYDAYTNDWNNVFARRKSNSDTLRRNEKITEENEARANKAKQQDTKLATGSVAKAKKLTPNLEINTGISAAADKLMQSLNNTGLGI